MQKSLRSRKQQLVNETIYDAAIDLFATKGYDKTTIEQIAEAAGVSRRSFFRYFGSKDAVIAHTTVQYAYALQEGVKTCKRGISHKEALEHTIAAGVQYVHSNEARLRKVIELCLSDASARQAQWPRYIEIEETLASAFASYLKRADVYDMESRLLAGVTLTLMNGALSLWIVGKQKDLATSAKKVFKTFSLFGKP